MRYLRMIFRAWRRLPRVLALARDPRVPLRSKVLLLGAIAFVLSPLNILGDLPLIGIADDAALLGLVLDWFLRTAGPYAAGPVPPPTAPPPSARPIRDVTPARF